MNLIELICRVLVKEHGLTEHSLPPSFHYLKGISSKEIFANLIDMENTRQLLDALVLLANSQTFLRHMDNIKIYQLLDSLKVKPFGETRDKIDVINAQIMSIDLPPIDPVEADDLD